MKYPSRSVIVLNVPLPAGLNSEMDRGTRSCSSIVAITGDVGLIRKSISPSRGVAVPAATSFAHCSRSLTVVPSPAEAVMKKLSAPRKPGSKLLPVAFGSVASLGHDAYPKACDFLDA